ncbi:TIR domain-containing protein [Amycolatopsis pigmentata]|uniref:TIR domain-containing protein n=1 Tax=Amycolatopsis pigmentata TaxID=450801 RepID=A0ABW5G486_9PSEU
MGRPTVPEIFVNYRTGDGDHVAALIERELSRRFGSDRIFRASKSIRPGENYRHALSTASSTTQVLLVIIGEKWLTLPDDNGNPGLDDEENWTRREILNAFDHGAWVIPILIGRKTPRLSPHSLPAALAPLADQQSITLDTGDPDPGLAKIAKRLVELVPGLVDRSVERSGDTGHTRNQLNGTVSGVSIQARDFQQTGGAVGRTVIHNAHGPVHTGDGDQHNQYHSPTFHGDGNNYITGKNTGGIHQKFGRSSDKDNNQ